MYTLSSRSGRFPAKKLEIMLLKLSYYTNCKIEPSSLRNFALLVTVEHISSTLRGGLGEAGRRRKAQINTT